MGCENLKPLQKPSPTGFYNFSGAPLSQEEVDTLRSTGQRLPDKPFIYPHPEGSRKVDPAYKSTDWDIMPDNRLKLAKHRTGWVSQRAQIPVMDKKEFKQKMSDFLIEYHAVPSPKPDFMDWFCTAHGDLIGTKLLRMIFLSDDNRSSLGALKQLLEFGKKKPKQQIESTEIAEFESTEDLAKAILQAIPPQQLLEMSIKALGKDFKKTLERIKQ